MITGRYHVHSRIHKDIDTSDNRDRLLCMFHVLRSLPRHLDAICARLHALLMRYNAGFALLVLTSRLGLGGGNGCDYASAAAVVCLCIGGVDWLVACAFSLYLHEWCMLCFSP